MIGAARDLFAERGYADVGTEEIVRAAGVTRGALYHHFDGKRDLFEAVYEQIEAELAERIAAGALAPTPTPRSRRCAPGPTCSSRHAPSRRRSGSSSSTGPRCSAGIAGARSPPSNGLGLIEASLEAAIEAGAIDRSRFGHSPTS